MRVRLIAVGKMRRGPERELVDFYTGRLRDPVEIVEIEARDNLPLPKRMEEEAERLIAALPEGCAALVLDERGKLLDSASLAGRIARWRDEGYRDLAVVVGGADGLSERLRRRADLLLALGKLTWPHMLVRPMILEQLYRAQQIAAGHPYHRA